MSLTTEEKVDNHECEPSSNDVLLMKVREQMDNYGIDALVVPTADPHLSEYVSDAFSRRAYLTGFDGSAGTALVTKDNAYLWTDSRCVLDLLSSLFTDDYINQGLTLSIFVL